MILSGTADFSLHLRTGSPSAAADDLGSWLLAARGTLTDIRQLDCVDIPVEVNHTEKAFFTFLPTCFFSGGFSDATAAQQKTGCRHV